MNRTGHGHRRQTVAVIKAGYQIYSLNPQPIGSLNYAERRSLPRERSVTHLEFVMNVTTE